MAKDLAKWAKEKGVKYFMVSYTDLFGGQRAKLVPAQAINDMVQDGAGFAGFATWLDMTPMGRCGEPSEVAALIVFLASDASAYMTGSIVAIDGGYTSL